MDQVSSDVSTERHFSNRYSRPTIRNIVNGCYEITRYKLPNEFSCFPLIFEMD